MVVFCNNVFVFFFFSSSYCCCCIPRGGNNWHEKLSFMNGKCASADLLLLSFISFVFLPNIRKYFLSPPTHNKITCAMHYRHANRGNDDDGWLERKREEQEVMQFTRKRVHRTCISCRKWNSTFFNWGCFFFNCCCWRWVVNHIQSAVMEW